MKIGILREGKIPYDKRVPLSPLQCSKIKNIYPSVEIFVQSSNHRCYSDKEYIKYGLKVVDNLKHCDVLLGIKEVPKSELIREKTYLFFFGKVVLIELYYFEVQPSPLVQYLLYN